MQPKDIVVGARYANELIESGVVYVGVKCGYGKRLKIIYPKSWPFIPGEKIMRYAKHPSKLKDCSPGFWNAFYRIDTVEVNLNSD
jgi:hypothetical protein